eukprot:6605981-Prymnesium_polylepis.1
MLKVGDIIVSPHTGKCMLLSAPYTLPGLRPRVGPSLSCELGYYGRHIPYGANPLRFMRGMA